MYQTLIRVYMRNEDSYDHINRDSDSLDLLQLPKKPLSGLDGAKKVRVQEQNES